LLKRLFKFFRTLTGRLVLFAVSGSALALIIGGLILSAAFHDSLIEDIDRRLERQIDILVGISQVGLDGKLSFIRPITDEQFTQPYSGFYWQVSVEGSDAMRSRSLWDYELTPDLSHRDFMIDFTELAGPDGQILRVAEIDAILPEDDQDRVFRYMVAIDMAPVKIASARYDRLLALALGIIMFVVAVGMIAQVFYGLMPLKNLRSSLGRVIEGRSRYIEGEWPEDLEPVADDINILIEKNEKLVDRARTHVGNLAHALKTPLAVIQNEVSGDTSKRGEAIVQNTRIIRDHVDHHLKRARISGAMGGPGVDVKDRLAKLVKAVSTMYAAKNIDFELLCPEGLRFAGEHEDFDEIMGNLIENAGKWTESKVHVRVVTVRKQRKSMIEITVDDDGPGVPAEDRATIFKRGKRLDERVPGTGLGLAIVRDITDMYEGSAKLDASEFGGLSAIITLPVKLSN